ncbi:hypothetical protein VNO78_15881 [Psophocarpus tetragonolobus]|uniref:RING-type domain-containing protein n=1 Tax=Psophocarpus tetragonolobus TaxID=3891 RepID=A0AAN9SFR2_PSOTE
MALLILILILILIIISPLSFSITMQNSPAVVAPPPFQIPPPPHPAGQITAIPFPPPPPIAEAPAAVFQITVLPIPPPPFAGAPSSVDLSPLEFLLALLAIVTIPALIYTFVFAFGCPTRHRREPSAGDSSVASQVSHHEVEISAASDGALKFEREAHAKEIGGECPVCLSAFVDGEEVRQLSACKHSFHAFCIDLWLSNHSNCPICRATIPAAANTTKSPGSNLNGASNLV